MTPFIPPSDSPTPHKSPLLDLIVSLNDDQAIVALANHLVERSGFSQVEVARSMGITKQDLNAILRGRVKRPSLRFMALLAHACGATFKVQWK